MSVGVVSAAAPAGGAGEAGRPETREGEEDGEWNQAEEGAPWPAR